ncbi:MAG TPA: ornithine carbamoyltransferase [Albitalea sp.]
MTPNLANRSRQGYETMSPREVTALLIHARALQRAAQEGTTQPLLKGKNFGLLCEAADHPDAQLFRRAAVELGAHVAHIRPSLSELTTPQEVQHTARVLGRLYDAVECQGMPPALVQQVGDDAGVPVYDGISGSDHPTARLADQLDGSSPPEDRRRFVLQALLIGTIA